MKRATGTALGGSAIAAWSCYGVLIASNTVTPPFLSMAIVFSCATAVLVLRRFLQGHGLKDLFQIPLSTLALGVTGLFGSNCLYVVALALGGEPVPVNIASLSWPVFMAVLIAVFRIARATWFDAFAMVIGFGGVMLLALQHGAVTIDWPVLVALAGALCWAAYSALRTRVPAGPSDAIIAFVAVSGIFCWIITLTAEQGTVPTDELVRLVLVGLIPVGLANLAWDLATRYGDPVLLSGLSFLEPLASTLLIAVVLSKPISGLEAAALGLIFIAVGCSIMSERSRRKRTLLYPAL